MPHRFRPTALRLAALLLAALACAGAAAWDRTASVGDSSPAPGRDDPDAAYQRLVRVIEAMDRATRSSTNIAVRPFARSLQETAAGRADFHFPFAQVGDAPAPPGLAYVTTVDFGHAYFVVYSRKRAPLDARSVARAAQVEVEPGHEQLFAFPTRATACIPCSLDKLLLGRIDALVVAAPTVDGLLADARYHEVHRALYGAYPMRALVPSSADSTATRRYLAEGGTFVVPLPEVTIVRGADAAPPNAIGV